MVKPSAVLGSSTKIKTQWDLSVKDLVRLLG